MTEVQRVGATHSRRESLEILLAGVFLLWLSFFVHGFFDYYDLMKDEEAIIRMSGGILMPAINILMMPISAIVVLVGMALTLGKETWLSRLRQKTSRIMHICIGASLFLLLIQPFATRYVMPKYGYHICQKLDGGLSIWHNDWVRNPDWCVRGKTREWVRAMALQEAGGDVDPEEAQRKAKSRSKEEPLMPFSWTLLAFVLGAVLWGNELRSWDQFRNRHVLLRWPMLVLAGLMAGFFTLVGAVAAYAMGGGKFWAVLLGVGFFVSWPLFGFLDERSSAKK